MIPTAEQLAAIAESRQGQLADVPFGVLLHALATAGRTATLEVGRRQVAKKILFEAGVPVDCRSNLAHETLGRFMVAAGKLAEADFTSCLARSSARGVPLGEVLIERGLVGADELFRILQQNLAKKLLDLFTWREGEFRQLDEEREVHSPLKVRVPQLVVTGITKLAPQSEVDAAVAPLVGKRLLLHPSPPFPVAEIRLSERQAPLIEALRSRPRLDELAAATALPANEMTRLVYALAVIGTITTADRLDGRGASQLPPAPPPAGNAPARPAAPGAKAPAEPPRETVETAAPAPADPPRASAETVAAIAAPAPGSPGAAAAAISPPDVERLRNEVMQAYLSYRKQDAFDLLGVPEEETPPGVERRFLDFAARFAPWRFEGPVFGQLAEKARDLFLAGARAYGQLAEREQRETLLYRRKTLREERSRRAMADLAIKTDLLDPEVQYRKGKAAMEAGRLREAVQQLEFASDCDPQNGLYRAELAYCRFLHSPSAPRPAIDGLEEALRIDPRCGPAYLYLGEIHRQLGNAREAEELLQRAIKLMAPDRRPIEALKALQSAKKRR